MSFWIDPMTWACNVWDERNRWRDLLILMIRHNGMDWDGLPDAKMRAQKYWEHREKMGYRT